MMKYEAVRMPDGSIEVLQTDGGEEVLGRLTFRDAEQFELCFYVHVISPGDSYVDTTHTGGKYLAQK